MKYLAVRLEEIAVCCAISEGGERPCHGVLWLLDHIEDHAAETFNALPLSPLSVAEKGPRRQFEILRRGLPRIARSGASFRCGEMKACTNLNLV